MQLDIGFLVYPDFQILDLAGPLAAFQTAGSMHEDAGYRLRTVSLAGGTVASSAGLAVATERFAGDTFDTLVVAGGAGSRQPAQLRDLAAAVREGAPRTRRVASVCTGAFVLAEAGLLEGRMATTHWRHAAELQRRYPEIKVDGDRIFTRDGRFWTSAGISAGVDLALALIEDDYGTEVARATAGELVVYYRRPGGQSQFSALLQLDASSDRIRTALAFARANLAETLSVERLAEVACLSPRQFGRSFLAETGETPAKAVERLRVEAARLRLENSAEPVEAIAREVGFTDPERMRRAFLRLFGQPPQGIRRSARRTATTQMSAPIG